MRSICFQGYFTEILCHCLATVVTLGNMYVVCHMQLLISFISIYNFQPIHINVLWFMQKCWYMSICLMAMCVIGFQVRNIPPNSFFILARFQTNIIFVQSLVCDVSVVLHCYVANAMETLSFSMSSNVALDSAKGIIYLHTEANPYVIHRDKKPATYSWTVSMVLNPFLNLLNTFLNPLRLLASRCCWGCYF